MRIAQVAPLYESVPPKLYGGTERVVSYLTEELVQQGHDVTLFASGDSETTARLVPVCEGALRLQGERIVDPIAHHLRMIEMAMRERSSFDVIHFHTDYLHLPATRRHPIASLTTLHVRLDIRDLFPLFREFSEAPLASISDSQRAPMPWANWLATVHHGLPEDLHTPRMQVGEYLAFLGRFSPEKRPDRAIEIAIRADMPMRIAAKIDGGNEEYFEAKIRKLLEHPLVEYVGEIGEGEKSEFLGNAAALLFPIDWPEPFGLVMIESMACGTPVIAWKRGSTSEIVDEGVTGYLVDSLEGAVEAVGKLWSFDRRICRGVFEQRFSARRMSVEYLKVYQRLLSDEAYCDCSGDVAA